MFGLNKHQPVAEHEADDDTERIYHEIRQVLRVSGVSLVFRSWAGFGRSFPLLWEAVRENAGTYAFERAADQLRAHAVRSALQLPAVHATADVPLGPSQLYQVGAALALYHYVDPKLLILASAVRLALDEAGVVGSPSADASKLPRGVPARMYPMEVVEEGLEDPRVRRTFDDIRDTLSISVINSDYRTLALWPGYLAAAWARLKPIVVSAEYGALAVSLAQQSEVLARQLPYRVKLSRLDLATVGDDDEEFVRQTRQFEQLLPPLMLNVALLTLDGVSADVCMESPFPVPEAAVEPA